MLSIYLLSIYLCTIETGLQLEDPTTVERKGQKVCNSNAIKKKPSKKGGKNKGKNRSHLCSCVIQ